MIHEDLSASISGALPEKYTFLSAPPGSLWNLNFAHTLHNVRDLANPKLMKKSKELINFIVNFHCICGVLKSYDFKLNVTFTELINVCAL